jgi:hypothetical protein
VTESLTKEERIQLSANWPPNTRLFLKLLRVHDELVVNLKACQDTSADTWGVLVKFERDRADEHFSQTSMARGAIIRHDEDRLTAVECVEVIRSILK